MLNWDTSGVKDMSSMFAVRCSPSARPVTQSAVLCPFPGTLRARLHAPVSHAASRLPGRGSRRTVCPVLATLGRARKLSTSR